MIEEIHEQMNLFNDIESNELKHGILDIAYEIEGKTQGMLNPKEAVIFGVMKGFELANYHPNKVDVIKVDNAVTAADLYYGIQQMPSPSYDGQIFQITVEPFMYLEAGRPGAGVPTNKNVTVRFFDFVAVRRNASSPLQWVMK